MDIEVYSSTVKRLEGLSFTIDEPSKGIDLDIGGVVISVADVKVSGDLLVLTSPNIIVRAKII